MRHALIAIALAAASSSAGCLAIDPAALEQEQTRLDAEWLEMKHNTRRSVMVIQTKARELEAMGTDQAVIDEFRRDCANSMLSNRQAFTRHEALMRTERGIEASAFFRVMAEECWK